jgi:hypothetical protein
MEIKLLRFLYRLDGASNFISWKARVILVLKEYDLWELVEKIVTPPTYLVSLESHNKKDTQEERVLIYSMKDHIIPHLSEKKMSKEMFDSLVILFQSKNMNRICSEEINLDQYICLDMIMLQSIT